MQKFLGAAKINLTFLKDYFPKKPGRSLESLKDHVLRKFRQST